MLAINLNLTLLHLHFHFCLRTRHLRRSLPRFGYTIYRRVLGYYSGPNPEDGLDMRKALPRDKEKASMVPLDHPITPDELEW